MLHLLLSAVSAYNFTYFGGPLVANAEVTPIFVGNVKFQQQLQEFYNAVLPSSYLDSLAEYSTAQYKIGRGTAKPAVHFNFTLDNREINTLMQEMLSSMAAAQLITPNDNSVYAIHFATTNLIAGGKPLCDNSCSVHNTAKINGSLVPYTVIPDFSGECAQGCGNHPNIFDNICSLASHELVESITDKGYGQATSFAFPVGWYDLQNGEFADLCQGNDTTIEGFTVQKYFSVKENQCV
ncbi:hypothetical protein HK103_003219 [Boothiomyces macroporosus]|uniref:Uncharacterized protein n=1 Tax=Boothiomyces macroporosus TaxID=261099 RepID=A0AAD5Y946_9FUNG|nr:hypothetical protein HK103_003219 [Boothiomyces macroporosus]